MLSTRLLAYYTGPSGWLTSNDGALLLWLPRDRRHRDKLVIQIRGDSAAPTHSVLDFSRFVHGDSWASVARA